MAEIQRVGMPARAKVKWSLPQAPLGMTEHNKPNRSSTSKSFQQQLQAARSFLSDPVQAEPEQLLRAKPKSI